MGGHRDTEQVSPAGPREKKAPTSNKDSMTLHESQFPKEYNDFLDQQLADNTLVAYEIDTSAHPTMDDLANELLALGFLHWEVLVIDLFGPLWRVKVLSKCVKRLEENCPQSWKVHRMPKEPAGSVQ